MASLIKIVVLINLIAMLFCCCTGYYNPSDIPLAHEAIKDAKLISANLTCKKDSTFCSNWLHDYLKVRQNIVLIEYCMPGIQPDSCSRHDIFLVAREQKYTPLIGLCYKYDSTLIVDGHIVETKIDSEPCLLSLSIPRNKNANKDAVLNAFNWIDLSNSRHSIILTIIYKK